MEDPLLSVARGVKRFGSMRALRGVDFERKASEIDALLGENGAGKWTLMDLFSGVYPPDKGAIRWKARQSASAIRARHRQPASPRSS